LRMYGGRREKKVLFQLQYNINIILHATFG
jgi:hypothetical protein